MADPQIAPTPGSGTHSPDWEKHRVPRSRKGSKGASSVQSLVALTRNAHRGIAKSEAAKLINKIASVTTLPLGKVRAELIPDSTWKRAGKTLGPQASQTTARLNHVFEFAQRIWGNERDAAECENAESINFLHVILHDPAAAKRSPTIENNTRQQSRNADVARHNGVCDNPGGSMSLEFQDVALGQLAEVRTADRAEKARGVCRDLQEIQRFHHAAGLGENDDRHRILSCDAQRRAAFP